MIQLIPRFYDVTGGRVLVNGVDVRQINSHKLREHIGFVAQKANLFSGTIEENIQFSVGLKQRMRKYGMLLILRRQRILLWISQRVLKNGL